MSPTARPTSTESLPAHHVNFDLEAGPYSTTNDHDWENNHSIRSEPNISKLDPSPILKRRQTRASTFKTIGTTAQRPNWHPGQEPGLDPLKENGGRPQTPTLHEECQITVVDYSQEDMVMRDLNNAQLIEFLEEPKEDWIACRWINVNGYV